MCLPISEQGDVQAQYNLGWLSAYGEGVPQDDKEAANWFRLAAEQGYTQAQVALGRAYARGQGVARDAAQAAEWYRRAAEQGM